MKIIIKIINKILNLPHDQCNYIDDEDQTIIIGIEPNEETIQKILDFGITAFVKLSDCNKIWYENLIPDYVDIINFPIKKENVPTIENTQILLLQIFDLISNDKNIYIYCDDGICISGMISAIIIGKILEMDTKESIMEIEKFINMRKKIPEDSFLVPETNDQVKLIYNFLKLKHGNVLPNRKNIIKSIELQEEIFFYDIKEKWGEFSNFFKVKIMYKGIQYKTSEHAFQAAKFPGNTPEELEYQEIIANANTPNIAYILAKQKTCGGYKWRTNLNPIITKYKDLGVKLRDDWEDVKVDIMREIVYIKFSENEKLKHVLLSTGNSDLYEHTNRDSFWADGGDGTGQNWLGHILMDVRSKL